MSVCNQCIKTTADSNVKYDKTIFLDISESYIEYNIFDSGNSIVESNNCGDTIIVSEINKLKLS